MRIAVADIARAQADALRRLLPAEDIIDIADAASAIDRVDVLIASRFSAAERLRFRLLQVPGAGRRARQDRPCRRAAGGNRLQRL
jgi:hypothetical protein